MHTPLFVSPAIPVQNIPLGSQVQGIHMQHMQQSSEHQAAGRVLVTGGTGYVGAWCVHYLLERGHAVTTTVRDPAGEKAQFLRDMISKGANLEMLRADLLDGEDVWQPTMKGIDTVLHVASPFPLIPPKKSQAHVIIDPAVKGTRIVMECAIKAGIRKVVLTSSIVAVSEPQKKGKVYTGADWSSEAKQYPYQKSKTMAERVAWELVKANPRTELCVICPGLIYGPPLSAGAGMDFTSAGTLKTVLTKEFPLLPDLSLGVVDVRDVAACHVAAVAAAGSGGKRLLAAPEAITMKSLVALLHQRWPSRGLKTPQGPKWLLQFAVPFDPKLAQVWSAVGNPCTYDCSETTEVLQVQFRPVKEGILEMAEMLVKDPDVPPPGCAAKLGCLYARNLCCGSRTVAS